MYPPEYIDICSPSRRYGAAESLGRGPPSPSRRPFPTLRWHQLRRLPPLPLLLLYLHRWPTRSSPRGPVNDQLLPPLAVKARPGAPPRQSRTPLVLPPLESGRVRGRGKPGSARAVLLLLQEGEGLGAAAKGRLRRRQFRLAPSDLGFAGLEVAQAVDVAERRRGRGQGTGDTKRGTRGAGRLGHGHISKHATM